MPLPCRHSSPVSRTLQSDESSITGTRAMSGSAASRFRNVRIACFESSSPSSMLTSMIWAPPSTCCRAIASASPYAPARTSFAKRGEPVTFVRSPTLTKFESGRITSGSSPAKRVSRAAWGRTRGATPRTACAMRRMCAGVVPQQPPTMLRKPLRAHSPSETESVSGVSSKPPKAFGSPAFG